MPPKRHHMYRKGKKKVNYQKRPATETESDDGGPPVRQKPRTEKFHARRQPQIDAPHASRLPRIHAASALGAAPPDMQFPEGSLVFVWYDEGDRAFEARVIGVVPDARRVTFVGFHDASFEMPLTNVANTLEDLVLQLQISPRQDYMVPVSRMGLRTMRAFERRQRVEEYLQGAENLLAANYDENRGEDSQNSPTVCSPTPNDQALIEDPLPPEARVEVPEIHHFVSPAAVLHSTRPSALIDNLSDGAAASLSARKIGVAANHLSRFGRLPTSLGFSEQLQRQLLAYHERKKVLQSIDVHQEPKEDFPDGQADVLNTARRVGDELGHDSSRVDIMPYDEQARERDMFAGERNEIEQQRTLRELEENEQRQREILQAQVEYEEWERRERNEERDRRIEMLEREEFEERSLEENVLQGIEALREVREEPNARVQNYLQELESECSASDSELNRRSEYARNRRHAREGGYLERNTVGYHLRGNGAINQSRTELRYFNRRLRRTRQRLVREGRVDIPNQVVANMELMNEEQLGQCRKMQGWLEYRRLQKEREKRQRNYQQD